MTLDEFAASANVEDCYSLDKLVIDALLSGKVDQRLILGFVNCAHMLETNPESVSVCITPQDRYGDVTLRTFYTLIDAFCFENNVPLIKVDECGKLYQALSDCKIRFDGPKPLGNIRSLQEDDCYCILIKSSDEKSVSRNDEELLDVLDDYQQFGCAIPTVTLPG